MTHTQIDAAWPAQVRLPGQTAAHPGPVDMTMMYVMHHAFRRDLSAFAAAAAATPVADREAWAALAVRWEMFSTALHHHHSGEDTGLWPLLMERTDDDGRAVLQAMEEEHERIDPILEACAAGFARLARHADEDTRAALAVRLVAGRESLAEHLRHEETEAIAIVQQVMTNEDWERLEEEVFKQGITFKMVVTLVPWVLHEVPGPLRRQLFAQPGGRVHKLIWNLVRRGFDRRERVAFRHVA
jgi:hypothetical protein